MKRYLVTFCLMILGSVAVAQTAEKNLQHSSRLNAQPVSQFALLNSDWLFNDLVYADDYAYNLLQPNNSQFTYLEKQNNHYGQQVMFRMKFADWLSLRLGVYDANQGGQLFMPTTFREKTTDYNDLSYQLGVSSVLDISSNWRLGLDLSTGQVAGDMIGLYQDQLDITSFGLGVRNQHFGASLHSDYASSQQNGTLYRSSIDLQVDWHFNKDGTLSFGARKNMNDNTGTNLDRFTGTVPYIKFKHNL
jgi:outer membrane receptor protein involved in Fe transport